MQPSENFRTFLSLQRETRTPSLSLPPTALAAAEVPPVPVDFSVLDISCHGIRHRVAFRDGLLSRGLKIARLMRVGAGVHVFTVLLAEE